MAYLGSAFSLAGSFGELVLWRQCLPPQQLISLRGSTVAQAQRPETTQYMNGDGSAAFVRPHLRKLAAYTPIEPFEVLSQRLGRQPEDIVKLDANENPYGPPPEVLAALGAMPFPNIYPDPETRQLRAALAQQLGVPMPQILVRPRALLPCPAWPAQAHACSRQPRMHADGAVGCAQVGCGADELIDLLMRCVLDVGDAIVDCPPTFTMYAFDAAVNGAQVVTVPRLDGFRLDVAGKRRLLCPSHTPVHSTLCSAHCHQRTCIAQHGAAVAVPARADIVRACCSGTAASHACRAQAAAETRREGTVGAFS